MAVWQSIRRLARRLLIATLIMAGAICGVIAVVFHKLVDLSQGLLVRGALRQHGGLRIALILAVPTIVSAILSIVVKRFAPITPGANLARVRRAYLQEPEILDTRSLLFTFFLTPLSLGSGIPLGPETPIVVVTSGACAGLARLLKLPKKVVRGMIPVGTAAGISAIFRTPITGVVFAVEEVLGTTSRGVLGGTIVAAVAAAVVQQLMLGKERLLPASAATWSHPSELLGFALVGTLAGLTAAAAIRTINVSRPWVQDHVPSIVLRAAIGGLSIGAIGLLAPEILSVGYPTTSLLLRGGGSLYLSAASFGGKTLGFILSMSAGLLGGTFAPSLFIGASLGSMVGHAARLLGGATIDPGAYALVGMGAYFGGFLRCPMAAVLIVLELTNDYELILPVMLAVAISTALSHRLAPRTLTEDQMIREGYRERDVQEDPLGALLVGEVMSPAAQTLAADLPLSRLVEIPLERRHQIYPVVSGEGGFLVGVLHAAAIIRNIHEGKLQVTVGELMEQPKVVAREDEVMRDVIERMAIENVDRCPVVTADGSKRVVGFVSPSDFVRVRFRRHGDEPGERSDITLF